jgi:hypothetical protein
MVHGTKKKVLQLAKEILSSGEAYKFLAIQAKGFREPELPL